MKPLLVHVDDIKDAAQPWEAEIPREDLDEVLGGDHPTEFHAAGACAVSARLTKMGRKVLVQSAFTVPLAGTCKRCLKDVTLTESVDLALTFNYVPEGAADHPRRKKPDEAGRDDRAEVRRERHDRDEEGPAGSFDPQLADEETYHGKTIDLGPVLREQILLAAPPSPVCREECKGLCPSCGQDLNLRDCGHKPLAVDPRWEALKAVQLTQPKHSKE